MPDAGSNDRFAQQTQAFPPPEGQTARTIVHGQPAVWEQTLAGGNTVAPAGAAPTSLGTIGDYELLRELGRGGMGVVYQARQRGLNRLVALKTVLSRDTATPEDIQRFRNEAEAAANLRHPGIVAVYEVGEAAGRHYYSMEFIAGDDLSRRIRDNALPAKEAAQYLVQLAEAVHYAHEHGVLHRDLKPSNVLVDEHNAVKISDFGLAKRVHADSQLTGAGMILGTPSYMSPEQAMPARGPVGAASDIYSLGAVLYELLTCRPPFRAENPLETIRQLLSDEPVAPRLLNPQIPQDLETICLKCLEKEPSRRYGSARLLADELQRFLAGEPILARPLNWLQRAGRWCRRYPRDAALIGTIVMAITAGMCGVGYQWQRAEVNLQRAQRTFDRLNTASDQMLEVVEEWVVRAPPRAGPQQDKLKSTLQLFAEFLHEEPTHTAARERLAATHQRVADIHRQLKQLDLAAGHYRLAIEQFERLMEQAPDDADYRRQVADAWDSLGNTEREADRFDDSRRAFEAALGIQEQLLARSASPRHQADLARTLYNRGLLRFQTGDRAAARDDLERAHRLLTEAVRELPAEPSFQQGLARCEINLGVVCRDRQEPVPALAHYDAAVEILVKLGSGNPAEHTYAAELAQARMNRGNLLLTDRQALAEVVREPLAEAQRSFEEATRVLETLARDYPNVPEYRVQLANSYNGQGAVHSVAGHVAAARLAYENARDQLAAVLRDAGPSADIGSRLGLALYNLALLIPRMQSRDRIPLLEQAIDCQREARRLNPQSPAIAGYLRSHEVALARALLQAGEHRRGAALAEQFLAEDAIASPNWRLAAELAIQASDVCRQDSQLDEAERTRLSDQYARQAVAALQYAVQSGATNPQALAADQAFAALREHRDFQRLLGDAGKP